MVERLLELLLAAKGALAAGILIVGSTGVVITGTLGPGNDVAIAVLAPLASASPSPTASPGTGARPTPSPGSCAEALAARDDAVRALQEERSKALADLRTVRRSAAALAKAGARELSEANLEAAEREFAQQIEQRLADALLATRVAADLAACEPADPTRGAFFDMADLRERYRIVLERLRNELRELLVRAGERFDALLKEAQPKPPGASTGSADPSAPHDSDDTADSDDD